MRIIGGKNKGKKIKVPKRGIRPTKGIIRGAIFNIIAENIHNAQVLDIFAGTGALGIEAIARGAESCVFIEKNPQYLYTNIKNLCLPSAEKIGLIMTDFRPGLKKVADQQFDIIFVDPPYQRDYIDKTLELISRYHLLKNQGLIVVEHSCETNFNLPADFIISKKKQYGKTAVSFISKDRAHDNSPDSNDSKSRELL